MRHGATIAEPKPLDALIEDARLATLQRYRTLPAERIETLFRLSRETAEALGATHASVCFVDGTRVWFGGAFGFDCGDISREGSFCDTVVRSGMPLLVPDGLEDPRFRHHELVCDPPGLRSYAGVPLIDGGGYTLGTVAIYSVAPGIFRSTVLTELGGLADLIRDFLATPIETAIPRSTREAVPPRAAAVPPSQVLKVQGWLGVKASAPKDSGGKRAEGLVVIGVAKGSPAAEAGLRPADLLHAIDGRILMSVPDITDAMAGRVPGTYARLSFRRGGLWSECPVQIRSKRRLVRVR